MSRTLNSEQTVKASSSKNIQLEVERSFDRDYYLATYPEVAHSGLDPASHFLVVGWRESRNPNANFDTRFYLEANPDVAAAGVNPYYHFLVAGRHEGRLPMPKNRGERKLISEARSAHDKAQHWLTPALAKSVLSASSLQDVLQKAAKKRDRLVVSFSHDEYTRVPGGIQNCLGDEQRAFNELGWDYLHLCPAQALPMLAERSGADFTFVASLNGSRAGYVTGDELSKVLQQKSQQSTEIVVAVHALLGHSPEIVAQLCRSAKAERVYVWVHDFFTLCSHYGLLRNDVSFCWAPAVDSGSCSICVYGEERRDHLRRMSHFFEQLNPRVLTPSAAARDFWTSRSGLRYASIEVVPHCDLEFTGIRGALDGAGRPLRVAFIGAAAPHKGWHVFEELTTAHRNDDRYDFFHLGTNAAPALGVRHVPVSVTPDHRQAMIQALLDQDIDVTVLWSLCYETFSFSAAESILAGTFALAPEDKGNLSQMVSQFGAARLLQSKTQLFDLFRSGEVIDVCRAARARGCPTGILSPGGITSRALVGSVSHA